MKTSKYLLSLCISTLLMSGCSSTKAIAQSNIDRVVNEIENNGDISVNTVIKRNRTTKKVYKEIKNFSFNHKTALAKKIQNAFNKDSKNAISVITTNRDNNQWSTTLIFEEGKKKSTYILNAYTNKSGTSNVNVSIISNNEANNDKDDESSVIINGMPLEQWKKYNLNGKELQAMNNFDWKEYNEEMKEYNEGMKKYNEKMKTFNEGMKEYNERMRKYVC